MESKKKYSWSDKTILVVEDDDISRIYLSEILGETDAEILYVNTGKEAVDTCRLNPSIDLILMDIRLPGQNGYLATKEIKGFRTGIPIIAQTALAGPSEKIRCIKAGCIDYISKPYGSDQLLRKILKYIS
jgi:CheY-like chemotaxis protein